MIARFDGTNTAFYLTDNIGSVRLIVNSSGAILDQVTYDCFGKILSETNSTNGDRFTYTGRELDSESALQYSRERFYDASNGRWTREDALGFRAGDVNLYRYTANTPLAWNDPTGAAPISPLMVLAPALMASVASVDVPVTNAANFRALRNMQTTARHWVDTFHRETDKYDAACSAWTSLSVALTNVTLRELAADIARAAHDCAANATALSTNYATALGILDWYVSHVKAATRRLNVDPGLLDLWARWRDSILDYQRALADFERFANPGPPLPKPAVPVPARWKSPDRDEYIARR
jgi:RHS repeat-associated protein